jgi:hypothetical protein
MTMSSFRRSILTVINLLLIAVGAGLFYFVKLCRDVEAPLRARLEVLAPEVMGTMAQDDLQGMHDIVKGVRVCCTAAGTVTVVAGVLNLWLGMPRRRGRFGDR